MGCAAVSGWKISCLDALTLQKGRGKAQGPGTFEMAKRVGISRTTLSAVEAGDLGPSMGTYLRVMSVLGVGEELALLAGDTMQPAPPGSAAAQSRRARPVVHKSSARRPR